MQDPIYREIILENWENPNNYGIVDVPDFDVMEHNPLCGDEIRLTGKISKGKLSEVRFESSGCAISKASASLFTQKIKGLRILKIRKITPEEVLEELGITLTPARTKCALLINVAVQKSVNR